MNTMKYFMMGALLFGCSLGTMAQDGTPADVDAVRNLVKNKPADYDKQLKAFVKANKKNADNIVAMGRALMEEGDTVRLYGHSFEYYPDSDTMPENADESAADDETDESEINDTDNE